MLALAIKMLIIIDDMSLTYPLVATPSVAIATAATAASHLVRSPRSSLTTIMPGRCNQDAQIAGAAQSERGAINVIARAGATTSTAIDDG